MTNYDPPDRLKLRLEPGSPPVAYASGELDYRNCEKLRSFLSDVIASHGPTVRLDLGQLEFVDSSGLKALGSAALQAAEASGSLVITSLAPQLLRILDVTGARELFEIPDDCEIVRSHTEPRADECPSCDFFIPSGADACRSARESVCDFAESLGFDESDIDDIRLAVGEAFSNAVRHGQAAGMPIHIRCSQLEDRLMIEFKYRGELFYPEQVPPPTAESGCEGGMGIYFMKLVMDAVKYQFREGYTHLILEKRLH